MPRTPFLSALRRIPESLIFVCRRSLAASAVLPMTALFISASALAAQVLVLCSSHPELIGTLNARPYEIGKRFLEAFGVKKDQIDAPEVLLAKTSVFFIIYNQGTGIYDFGGAKYHSTLRDGKEVRLRMIGSLQALPMDRLFEVEPDPSSLVLSPNRTLMIACLSSVDFQDIVKIRVVSPDFEAVFDVGGFADGTALL